MVRNSSSSSNSHARFMASMSMFDSQVSESAASPGGKFAATTKVILAARSSGGKPSKLHSYSEYIKGIHIRSMDRLGAASQP